MKTIITFLPAFALILGCSVGPDYRRPPVDTPDVHRSTIDEDGTRPAGSGAPDAASLADLAWWEVFDDPFLANLIDEALIASHDVRQAAWRIEEARARLGLVRSDGFPGIQGDGGWSRGRQSEHSVPGGETVGLNDLRVGLTWEVDLWGRIRRENEAELARYLSTEEARRGVFLSLVSEVATAYFQLRALDLQLDIARRTADDFEETRDLFDRRLQSGLASALETTSALASLRSTAATIPALEARVAAEENHLAFLLGRTPQPIERGAGLEDQTLPPTIPAGLPSDLLRRRPDLRQAEQALMAANAEVGAAVAAYFPTVRITGAFGGVSPDVSGLFQEGKTWSVGGGLVTPLFQGRRLKNQHRASVARFEQARVAFERSVHQAFREVSTALIAYGKLADVEADQARAVAAHRESVDLVGSRYDSGLSDYLEVLQARQQLFPAENALVRTRFDRLHALVDLYRALGGGWQRNDDGWGLAAGP